MESRREDRYVSRRCSPTPHSGCDALLSARNQSTLAVIVSRYRMARRLASRGGTENSVLSKAAENRSEKRQLHMPPRTRTSARLVTRERRAPSPEGREKAPGKAAGCFLTKASAEYAFRHPRDDESGKRYRSGEPGSIIPTRVPLSLL